MAPRAPFDDDFLGLYIRACGVSEVPLVWHTWSAIALVAACLNDRVYYCKHQDDKLFANLYVALVGESGTGKDTAIKRAAKFAKGLEGVFKFHGKLSGAGLADVLATPAARDASGMDRPTIWLTLPELSNSIGKGAMADDFIKRITALYGGDDDDYREITRGLLQEGRELDYGVPLLNCTFGSAQKWLIECVSPEAVESGAFARILTVPGTYDTSIRITDPSVPVDYAALTAELKRRLRRLVTLEGEYVLLPDTARLRDRWYQTRPAPTDPRLLPSWRRADDATLKLSMVLQASDATSARWNGADPMAITPSAWKRASRYVNFAHNALPHILRWATIAGSSSTLPLIEDILRRAGRIAHSALLKKVNHRGVEAKALRVHLSTLVERRDIEVVRTTHGAKVYQWISH